MRARRTVASCVVLRLALGCAVSSGLRGFRVELRAGRRDPILLVASVSLNVTNPVTVVADGAIVV